MTGSHTLDTMEQMQWIRRCTMRHIIPRNVSCDFADRMKNLLRKKNLVSLHWKVEIFDLNQKNLYLYDAGVNWTVRVSNLMLYVKFWWYSLYFSNLTSDLILYNVLYISIYKLTHNIKICCYFERSHKKEAIGLKMFTSHPKVLPTIVYNQRSVTNTFILF